MKKHTWLLPAIAFAVIACNNEAKDSVEKADSINEAKIDSVNTGDQSTQTIVADEESASFLVKAANIGMAEVQLGELAQQKAVNPKVKDFGSMIVHDHSGANSEVKTFASKRNVTLPDSISSEKRKEKDELSKKSGADFDKAFMRTMVNNHDDAIDLFQRASDKVKDNEVKTFVDNTLPKLRNHLDSAKAIQKGLK